MRMDKPPLSIETPDPYVFVTGDRVVVDLIGHGPTDGEIVERFPWGPYEGRYGYEVRLDGGGTLRCRGRSDLKPQQNDAAPRKP